ncbi:hypothetical protein AHEV_017 [Adoxophyes honmai entomopoxvirus 'L']|uniref:Uncharacterized protein n=1 Tax=Adoxophyes honmai entomopoxvirus 'L' TaxID=1293540 RepID=A0A916KNR7_9POXV|nr:hypothetical protein AHEV_017 [Adoxophyes honmai entomopoxvirus 'L']CCU55338.1 hypothetical protein AHEV_017 [Adoxophyes honmai entomopoxvirus 'L']
MNKYLLYLKYLLYKPWYYGIARTSEIYNNFDYTKINYELFIFLLIIPLLIICVLLLIMYQIIFILFYPILTCLDYLNIYTMNKEMDDFAEHNIKIYNVSL